ncbi:hypothetical protein JTB14_015563 [Gonioctena quinquepunctata]|nr:hypothetical protein JTB14_015563 [Gonioctena quinquepunctata]
MLVNFGMHLNQLHPIEGRNCLHYVAMTGYRPLALYLISEGIDTEAVDATNRTPYDIAREHGNFEVETLLDGSPRRRVSFSDELIVK